MALESDTSGMWAKTDGCLYRIPTLFANTSLSEVKIAGFDMDSTLILSNNGSQYATSVDGWVWAYPNVIEKIQELSRNGYMIVIFSNRKGAPWMIKPVQDRIDKMATVFRVPLWAFLATKSDSYRKPEPGMMVLFSRILQCTKYHPDSFYCGDAAGDHANPNGVFYLWHRWSSDDYDFAKNVGLPFKEPDQIFNSWPGPTIPPNVNLIITCGQYKSGWDRYEPYAHTINDLEDGRQLIVVDYLDLTSPAYKPPIVTKSPVYMVIGTNPTMVIRDQLRHYFNSSRETSLIYMYYRGAYDAGFDSEFISKSLELPSVTHEQYIRCN